MKLLICGVPGAGKTTFGNWLRDNKGFGHFNLEDEKSYKLFMIDGFYKSYGDIVASWGFVPNDHAYHTLKNLIENEGYSPIWLDDGGRRERSYKRYLKRKGKNTWQENFLYFRQVLKIDAVKCYDALGFKIINPFKNSRSFKDAGTLFEEIKKAVSGHSYAA